MANNFIPLEIIYFYLLLEKTLSGSSKCLIDFLKGNNLLDIKIFDTAKKILVENYNLEEFKIFVQKNKFEPQKIEKNIKNLKCILEIYIQNNIAPKKSKEEIKKKIKLFINNLNTYENLEIIDYFKGIAKFLYKKSNNRDLIITAIYSIFEEYMDLFLDAEEIIFNSQIINNNFADYFYLLNEKINTITFFNQKENIKIMQNILPDKCFCKILKILGYKYLQLKEKYFLLEMDKKLGYENNSPHLKHEVGHLLNLFIYNFQIELLQALYMQDPTINTVILNNWLNEISADIIASFLTENYTTKHFEETPECGENETYPSTSLRLAIITDSNFDYSIFQNPQMLKIAQLIYKNKDFIKKMLSIVK